MPCSSPPTGKVAAGGTAAPASPGDRARPARPQESRRSQAFRGPPKWPWTVRFRTPGTGKEALFGYASVDGFLSHERLKAATAWDTMGTACRSEGSGCEQEQSGAVLEHPIDHREQSGGDGVSAVLQEEQ